MASMSVLKNRRQEPSSRRDVLARSPSPSTSTEQLAKPHMEAHRDAHRVWKWATVAVECFPARSPLIGPHYVRFNSIFFGRGHRRREPWAFLCLDAILHALSSGT